LASKRLSYDVVNLPVLRTLNAHGLVLILARRVALDDHGRDVRRETASHAFQ
jgi:hypothetical protein